MVADKPYPVIMEEVTNPVELAEAQAQWECFDRNFAWLKAHTPVVVET
jgi:hypothetical protein